VSETRTALVTGANKGIGYEIAAGLGALGYRVGVGARDRDRLGTAVEELRAAGVDAFGVPLDVTDDRSAAAAAELVEREAGRLDVLVNNAGLSQGAPIDEMPLELWNQGLAVNLTGPFLCARAAMRIMKRQRGGRIINIGSVSAQRVRPNNVAYNATKHGIWGLTQSIALEGRSYGISCGALHPGNTKSEMTQGAHSINATEPMMEADELAQVAILMASLPPHVNMLEAIVLPVDMLYIGRG
jgi:NAD(P)-dependent dehydrogenase (short-subunit alcohol dehydrogenase family)